MLLRSDTVPPTVQIGITLRLGESAVDRVSPTGDGAERVVGQRSRGRLEQPAHPDDVVGG